MYKKQGLRSLCGINRTTHDHELTTAMQHL